MLYSTNSCKYFVQSVSSFERHWVYHRWSSEFSISQCAGKYHAALAYISFIGSMQTLIIHQHYTYTGHNSGQNKKNLRQREYLSNPLHKKNDFGPVKTKTKRNRFKENNRVTWCAKRIISMFWWNWHQAQLQPKTKEIAWRRVSSCETCWVKGIIFVY